MMSLSPQNADGGLRVVGFASKAVVVAIGLLVQHNCITNAFRPASELHHRFAYATDGAHRRWQ